MPCPPVAGYTGGLCMPRNISAEYNERKMTWAKVRGPTTGLSACATAFVPPGTGLSASAVAFVPPALVVPTRTGTSAPAAWAAAWGRALDSPGAVAVECGAVAVEAEGYWRPNAFFPAFEQKAVAAPTASLPCWFNFDAFASDSDSSQSPSPRGRAGQGDAATPAMSSTAAVTPVFPGTPVAPPAAANAAARVPAMPATPATPAAPFTPPRASPRIRDCLPLAGQQGSTEVVTSSEAAVPLSMQREDSAEGAVAVADTVVVAEMSERRLKEWLQRFANDGDRAMPGHQDDCGDAGPVMAAIRCQLVGEGFSRDLLERCFRQYSEEDLEDLGLDHPKVAEFLVAIRSVLDGASAVTGCSGQTEGSNHVETQAEAETTKDGFVAPFYTVKCLLAVRRSILAAGEPLEKDAPRWRTQAASALFAPLPQWAQRRAQEAHGDEESNGSLSREWRDAQRLNFEARVKEGKKASGRQPKDALHVSQTSWAAQVKRKKEELSGLGEDAETDERFVRDMRASLNKLTIEKFDQLSEQIVLLVSQSSRPNKGIPLLMQLVFEKATTQHHFISMYVNLCIKLHRWLTENDRIVDIESPTNFKRILLNQCQTSFEQYLEPPEGLTGLQGDELYEAQVKYKTKMLGNIKLVGALIRHSMLAPKIAIVVGSELVRDDPICLEERLETLAVFLETVGPSLDDPTWSHYSELDEIFMEVQRLVERGAVAARISFLLQNVLDRRQGKWQVQRVHDLDTDAPMTLAQVHQKAKQDQTPKEASARDRVVHAAKRKPWTASAEQPQARSPVASPASSPFMGAKAAPHTLEAVEQSPGERLVLFRKELAQVIRQIGSGLDVLAAARRLRACAPAGRCLEEAVDLIARVVDEPRARRQQLFPLLSALFAEGVFSPARGLPRAVEKFAQDAFADPARVDPPDLGDIVVREMLPALALVPGDLRLPLCLQELVE